MEEREREGLVKRKMVAVPCGSLLATFCVTAASSWSSFTACMCLYYLSTQVNTVLVLVFVFV